MAEDNIFTYLLLLTGNVGSAFEEESQLLETWIESLHHKIAETKPQFIAIHLQEVGGKNYEKSMKHVQNFITQITKSDVMIEYDRYRIYIDEEFSTPENFTALGNLYFAHNSIGSLKIWNFLTCKWETTIGKALYLGNIELVETKIKSKFPTDFFPQFKFSRKGFMSTRWEINYTSIDLINIHLFHDVSNLAACEENFSKYSEARRRALLHTLKRLDVGTNKKAIPFVIFGDFNFRCDTRGVVANLTKNLIHHRIHNVENNTAMAEYFSENGEKMLTIGKKEFKHISHQLIFKMPWLKKYDKELEAFKEILFEFPIKFPPSYPYEENPLKPNDFLYTRCPAWCDRIILSFTAKSIFSNIGCRYCVLGKEVCMGDHKPIYLYIKLKNQQDLKFQPIRRDSESKYIFKHHIEVAAKNLVQLEKTFGTNYIRIHPFCADNVQSSSQRSITNNEIKYLKSVFRETSF